MITIPPLALGIGYLASGVIMIATAYTDFSWAKPGRYFMAAVLVAWGVYWTGVWLGWDVMILHPWGRWMHLSNMMGPMLIAGTRWYADRNGK